MADNPDNSLSDDEMKQKLQDALEGAHPEESEAPDAFSTDALGNSPIVEKDTGEPDGEV